MAQGIQNRITQVIDNQYNGVKKNFCEKLGIKQGTLFSMFRKNTNPSFEMIQKILENHRDINPYWLILGEGKVNDTMSTEEVENCQQKLETAQKEIEYLKKINSLLEKQK
ncbi:hypothetical protein [Aureispira anguillae]|uniref:HTH cro/C1-type domain-containing protein n=1 Tax=Aureispira anguillae TaxID=2864201 RepID=A0A915YBN9_9BACT|nr:hypothetical protein [Aureispira anguillae]BDS10126.1 hypothetical protein AsAng_0008340 [Aureispira anguillae]